MLNQCCFNLGLQERVLLKVYRLRVLQKPQLIREVPAISGVRPLTPRYCCKTLDTVPRRSNRNKIEEFEIHSCLGEGNDESILRKFSMDRVLQQYPPRNRHSSADSRLLADSVRLSPVTSTDRRNTCDIMGKAGNVSGRPKADIGDVERLVGDREFRFDECAIYPLTA